MIITVHIFRLASFQYETVLSPVNLQGYGPEKEYAKLKSLKPRIEMELFVRRVLYKNSNFCPTRFSSANRASVCGLNDTGFNSS